MHREWKNYANRTTEVSALDLPTEIMKRALNDPENGHFFIKIK